MADAVVRMQAIVVDGEELIVHIVIECEKCGGDYDLVFSGHHVRPIVELLSEVLHDFPDLTNAGHITDGARRTFTIHPREN